MKFELQLWDCTGIDVSHRRGIKDMAVLDKQRSHSKRNFLATLFARCVFCSGGIFDVGTFLKTPPQKQQGCVSFVTFFKFQIV